MRSSKVGEGLDESGETLRDLAIALLAGILLRGADERALKRRNLTIRRS